MHRQWKRDRKYPAIIFVLRGLVPYTRENLLLAFKPSRFFYELEKASGYSQKTLRSTYYRARQSGYISADTVPQLTEKGLRKVKPYQAELLGSKARLIVLFDIPEAMYVKRNALRRLLRSLEFEMVQQSVWMTDRDHRELLLEAVRELELEGFVEIHESLRLYPD